MNTIALFNSRVSYLVLGFLAGIVVATLAGPRLPMPILDLHSAASSTSVSTSTAMLPPESGDVAVGDQSAGMTVVLDSVTVPPPGVWAAVHELNQDGSLGNVLGAARVKQPLSNVSVQLLRPTLSGERYAVVLYRDDGDTLFNLANDSVYIDFTTGSRVEELFTAK